MQTVLKVNKQIWQLGPMCTLQTGKLCYNAININYVLVLICRIANLGNLIALLSWFFVKVFADPSYY